MFSGITSYLWGASPTPTTPTAPQEEAPPTKPSSNDVSTPTSSNDDVVAAATTTTTPVASSPAAVAAFSDDDSAMEVVSMGSSDDEMVTVPSPRKLRQREDEWVMIAGEQQSEGNKKSKRRVKGGASSKRTGGSSKKGGLPSRRVAMKMFSPEALVLGPLEETVTLNYRNAVLTKLTPPPSSEPLGAKEKASSSEMMDVCEADTVAGKGEDDKSLEPAKIAPKVIISPTKKLDQLDERIPEESKKFRERCDRSVTQIKRTGSTVEKGGSKLEKSSVPSRKAASSEKAILPKKEEFIVTESFVAPSKKEVLIEKVTSSRKKDLTVIERNVVTPSKKDVPVEKEISAKKKEIAPDNSVAATKKNTLARKVTSPKKNEVAVPENAVVPTKKTTRCEKVISPLQKKEISETKNVVLANLESALRSNINKRIETPKENVPKERNTSRDSLLNLSESISKQSEKKISRRIMADPVLYFPPRQRFFAASVDTDIDIEDCFKNFSSELRLNIETGEQKKTTSATFNSTGNRISPADKKVYLRPNGEISTKDSDLERERSERDRRACVELQRMILESSSKKPINYFPFSWISTDRPDDEVSSDTESSDLECPVKRKIDPLALLRRHKKNKQDCMDQTLLHLIEMTKHYDYQPMFEDKQDKEAELALLMKELRPAHKANRLKEHRVLSRKSLNKSNSVRQVCSAGNSRLRRSDRLKPTMASRANNNRKCY